MGKYFTVEIKPTVTASKQHIGVFTAGDVLFDWTEFEIPKGSANLIGATVLVRPKGDASPTANAKALSLLISKSNTVSLGTINSDADNKPSNDLVAHVELADADFTPSKLNSTAIGTTPTNVDDIPPGVPTVITANQNLASTSGFDKFYIGALSGAQFFTTLHRINDADIDSASPGTALAIDGNSMNALEHFLPGDVLHAHDDAVIGTAAVVANGTITLTEAIATGVLEDDDFVYNIHPIRIILQFEQ
jgi:hypothetical protein|tara:strand:+ start:182 stop:925 length:744 start_codon:yes stop_codon:yes gene_type:complete